MYVYVYKFNTGPKIFDFIHLWFAGFHNSEYLGFKKSDTIYIYIYIYIYLSHIPVVESETAYKLSTLLLFQQNMNVHIK